METCHSVSRSNLSWRLAKLTTAYPSERPYYSMPYLRVYTLNRSRQRSTCVPRSTSRRANWHFAPTTASVEAKCLLIKASITTTDCGVAVRGNGRKAK